MKKEIEKRVNVTVDASDIPDEGSQFYKYYLAASRNQIATGKKTIEEIAEEMDIDVADAQKKLYG